MGTFLFLLKEYLFVLYHGGAHGGRHGPDGHARHCALDEFESAVMHSDDLLSVCFHTYCIQSRRIIAETRDLSTGNFMEIRGIFPMLAPVSRP